LSGLAGGLLSHLPGKRKRGGAPASDSDDDFGGAPSSKREEAEEDDEHEDQAPKGGLGFVRRKLAPLLLKLSGKMGPLGAKLKPLADRLAPLAHKVGDEFHHVVEEVEDHIHLPPAFEHVVEHIPEKRRTAVLAGAGVLGIGFLIGLGIWLMGGHGGGEPQAGSSTPSLSLPMPPRAGPGAALMSPSPPPEGALQPQPGGDGGAPVSPQAGAVGLPPAAGPGQQAPEGTAPAVPPAQPGGPEQQTAQQPAAKPGIPVFEAPSLKEMGAGKLTSLSPVTGEPKLPANSGQLSVPKYAELPAPPPPPQPVPMPEAPQSALLKKTDAGSIPVVGPDGREAWKTYARPFDLGDKRPRIAVVVYDLGQIKEAGEAAIAKLPPEVTLSFSPYAVKLEDWVKRAHAAGHETLLDLPLDSKSFPLRDPGPSALVSTQSSTENQRRLETFLAKAQGYNGLLAVDGQRFLTSSQQVDMLFRTLKQSGLLFVDNGLAGDNTTQRVAEMLELPFAKANVMIDERHFRTAVDIRLRKAEDDASAKGRALIVMPARPLFLDRLATWSKDLSTRGIVLAPLSAVVQGKPQP
jgi:polysaccharide deacetylase 2 family uncharacterized protein YibQ